MLAKVNTSTFGISAGGLFSAPAAPSWGIGAVSPAQTAPTAGGVAPFSGLQPFGGASGGFGATPVKAQMPEMAQIPEMAQMTPTRETVPPSPAPPSTFEKLTMGAGGALEPFTGFGGGPSGLTNLGLVTPAAVGAGRGGLEPFSTASGALETFSAGRELELFSGSAPPGPGAVELFSGGQLELFDPRASEPLERARAEAEVHPQLSTLSPQPSTLHPQPSTQNPQPSSLNF